MRLSALKRLPIAVILVLASCDGEGSVDPTPIITAPSATASASQTIAPPSATATVPSETAIPTPMLPTSTPPAPVSTPTLPPSNKPSQAVRRVESAAVFLTFDAGADRGYAAEILDILQSKQVRASFGLTGAWAEANPDLVHRIAGAGHTIMNHTYDHPSFTGASSTYVALTTAERQYQLSRAEAAFAAVADTRGDPFFRPPFGDYDESVLADVGQAGYRFSILWTIDSGGWRGLTAKDIVDRASAAEAGDIIIMHVGSFGDFEALAETIDRLRSRGLATAAIGDVLR